MGFEIPKRQLKSIQVQKRNVPIDQIIAVQGQNPFAQGIETAGNVLGQAMSERLRLQRDGQQLAALGKITGEDYTGLDPTIAAQLAQFSVKSKQEGKKKPLGQPVIGKDGKASQYFYDEKTDEIISKELPLGAPPPKPAQDESNVYIGNDGNGNPVVLGTKSKTLTSVPLPGGGSVFPKNQPGVTQKDVKDIDAQMEQIASLRKMLGDIPSGITGGATSVASKLTFGAVGGTAKQYNDLKPSVATKIYRAMTGDNRLSDADAAARAYPLLPSLAEPADVREAKLKNIEDILTQRKSISLAGGGLKQMETPTAKQFVEPDVAAYAKKHEISYEQALAIKKQRTGQ